MKKMAPLKGFIRKFILLLSLVTLCSTASAIPIKQLPPSINSNKEVIESVSQWNFSDSLKLVLEDLKNGDKEGAKLRLAQFLNLHKDDPGALSLAGVILFDERNYVAAEDSFNRLLKQGVKTSEIYALAGVSAQMQGKTESAKRSFEKSLSLNPDQVLALRSLARLAMANSRAQLANKYFDKILNNSHYKNSALTKVHLEAAEALLQTNQAEKAVKILSIKHIPAELKLAHTFALARTYATMGHFSKSLTVLDNASIEKDDEFFLNIEKVRILAQAGQLDKALRITDSLITEYPDARTRLYYDKGLILASQKQFLAAGDSIIQSATFAKKNEQSLLSIQASKFYFKAGEEKKAETLLKKALKNKPDDLAVKYELAALQSQTANLKGADKLLDEILAKRDDYFLAHYLKGVIAWNQKQILKAFLHFNEAVNINPQYVDAWLALSEVEHIRSGDQHMREKLEFGLKNNPGNPALRYQLAIQAFSVRDYERTKNFLENFPENSGNYGDAQSLLILVLIEQNKPTDTIKKVLDRAKVISPNNIYISDAEGYFLAKNGKASEGIEILKKAAEHAQDDAVIYLHLSEALVINGNKKAAKKALDKAISLGESSENEQFIIDKLKTQLL